MLETTDYDHNNKDNPIKVYKRRWLVLILFVLYGSSNLIQTMHYAIIANIVVKYYDTSFVAVNWTAMISGVVYIVICVPGNYFVTKLGLRKTVLIGIVGTCIGTYAKFASIHPDRFWVALLSQGFISIFHVCIVSLFPKLAATWFPANEVATATGLSMMATGLGSSLSFLIPTLIVSTGSHEEMENGLFLLIVIFSVFTSVVAVLLFFFFPNEPPYPPSIAQKNSVEENKLIPDGFLSICKRIFTNRSFMIYLIVHSINVRSVAPYQTILNQIMLHYYPDAGYHIGTIGLIGLIVTPLGAVFISIGLDRFKAFKATVGLAYGLFFVSVALYVALLDQGIPFVYFTTVLIGIFDGSLCIVAVEVIVELTYPEPENITTGIMIVLTQISSTAFISVYEAIFREVGILYVNIGILTVILVSDLLFYFVKFDLRRQAAQNLEKDNISLQGDLL